MFGCAAPPQKKPCHLSATFMNFIERERVNEWPKWHKAVLGANPRLFRRQDSASKTYRVSSSYSRVQDDVDERWS